jgi:hypothetical protein
MIAADEPKLSGALNEIAELPRCTSAAHALVRIRAALLAEGERIEKLSLIAAICVEGIAAEDNPRVNIVPMRTARRRANG